MIRFRRHTTDNPNKVYSMRGGTARDFGDALFLLHDAVLIRSHPYLRDPSNKTGICWCGADDQDKIHNVKKMFDKPKEKEDNSNESSTR